jgi:hypothetical protein
MTPEERARAFRQILRRNNAYARTVVGPDGLLPSREAAKVVAAHWLKVTKEVRADIESEGEAASGNR